VPIAIFDSATIPRDRRAELEAAVVVAGKLLSKRFEGWIVATPATAAEVTERVRVAMED
jgi:hypothetical protein